MSCSAVPKSKPRGVLCPDCAVPMGVAKTRQHINIVKRRRYCPQCGRRVTTQERPVSSPTAGSQ